VQRQRQRDLTDKAEVGQALRQRHKEVNGLAGDACPRLRRRLVLGVVAGTRRGRGGRQGEEKRGRGGRGTVGRGKALDGA